MRRHFGPVPPPHRLSGRPLGPVGPLAAAREGRVRPDPRAAGLTGRDRWRAAIVAQEHLVFLAFANAHSDLRELREESRRLQALFERFRDDKRCSLIFQPTATWDQIYKVLTSQPDDIA